MRIVSIGAALLALAAISGGVRADDKPVKAQMVKGTIKKVEADKMVLIVLQDVKGEKVDRELSITADTVFEITVDGKAKTALGKEGLFLLEKREGAKVQVKCDKDVNVLKVTVKGK